VGLVYAEQYISYTENESFEECKLQNAKIYRVPDYKPEELMLRCITGSQPMWRKSLHDKIGYFNTSYTIAADYDMWLRIANISNLLHVHGPLGVVFYSPTTISGAENTRQLNLEVLAIQRCFICQAKWRNLPGIRKQVAAELFGRGYQRIKHENDNRAAEPFIREAIKLDPTNISYLKTYLIRCIPYIMN
jgi:hypothetical protein